MIPEIDKNVQIVFEIFLKTWELCSLVISEQNKRMMNAHAFLNEVSSERSFDKAVNTC